MTETSFFWDDTTVGDAVLAPYDATEVADAMAGAIGDFVVPFSRSDSVEDHGRELILTQSVTTGKVSIQPGSAFVAGIFYTNDELIDVSITSNASGNPRIDRIVLERDDVAQTVRAAVVVGTPAATPVRPTISSDEMSLGWVWVADGYDSGVDTISTDEMHDERVFRENGPSANYYNRNNALKNAEFMAWSDPTAAPDKWLISGTPTFAGVTGTFVNRGISLSFTTNAGTEGVETTVGVNEVYNYSEDRNALFTFSCKLDVDAGTGQIWIYRVDLVANTATLEKFETFHPMGASDVVNVVMRVQISNASAQDAIRILIIGGTGTDDIQFGMPVLTGGYIPTKAYNHEVIMLDHAMACTNWTSTAKSTALNFIDLSTEFSGVYLWTPYLRGIIARVRCRDSGSAAATAYTDSAVTLHHYLDSSMAANDAVGIVSCAGRANDTWAEDVIYIPLEHMDGFGRFNARTYATGAGTLDVTIEVIGMIT